MIPTLSLLYKLASFILLANRDKSHAAIVLAVLFESLSILVGALVLHCRDAKVRGGISCDYDVRQYRGDTSQTYAQDVGSTCPQSDNRQFWALYSQRCSNLIKCHDALHEFQHGATHS